ncbi:MAG: insulinase family protein, partial [Phycisphaerae bacterium]|nr:insulinase family protein [Phycisphaerae bacterium]
IDAARAVKLAEQTFGQWQAEGALPEITLPPIPEPQPRHIILVDRPGAQSQIRVGQLGITRDHPDYFISRVVNGYFSGGFSGRLMESIRQEKGLTYGVGGGYRADRFAGRFIISTFSKTGRTAEAVQAIFDEIDRLRTEPPTADELKLVKSYVLGSFVGDRETPQSIAGDIWLLRSMGLDMGYFDRLLGSVASAKADDCMRLVNATLNPDKMVVVVVGSAKKLLADLEKIAPVTVIEPDAKGADEASADADAGTP